MTSAPASSVPRSPRHCSQVDPLREEILDLLDWVQPAAGSVPFYSTVTGTLIDTGRLDTSYWFDNARRPVDFQAAIQSLLAAGHVAFLEVSTHPVLTLGIHEIAEEAGIAAAIVTTLRRQDGGLRRFLTSAAEAALAGLPVDLGLPPAHLDLPTYAFQHQRYWLEGAGGSPGNVAAAGLSAVGHPLLGAAILLAEADTWLLTGRVSLGAHPWLADHGVRDTVLLPGTAFAELAIRAADEVGCPLVEELILEAPLVLPRHGAVCLQVLIGAAEDSGQRPLTVHARPEGADELSWTRHASGVLSPAASPAAAIAGAWPPVGAVPIDLTGFYDRLAEAGYGYGPAVQRLGSAWRRGSEVFAEVSLAPEQRGEAAAYGLHPALWDAALHAIRLAEPAELSREARLPFAWRGVSLSAAGAATARVRVSPTGAGAMELVLADAAGQPVATVQSLTSRPVSGGQLGGPLAAWPDALFRITWTPVPVSTGPALVPAGPVPADAVYRCAAGQPARLLSTQVLATLQDWLTADRPTPLAIVTSDGDLSHAAVRGLVRSAQAENPGCFVLVELAADAPLAGTTDALLAAAMACGEPEVAVRDGGLWIPRLVRAAPLTRREGALSSRGISPARS